MSDILHNNFYSACGYSNLTEDPNKFGEPVYINTDAPLPTPEPVRKDISMGAKIGIAVVAMYLTYKFIFNEGK